MPMERARSITRDLRSGQDALFLHADGSVAMLGKVPKLFRAVVEQSFVRPRGMLRCCCTRRLRPKVDRALSERICYCEFRHARTENGVAVYRQVP